MQSLGYKTSIVINKNSYLFQPPDIFRANPYNVISCPSHNPLNINSWINNPISFGIKWKYILQYLKECNLNNIIKERLRYISIGKYIGSSIHFPRISCDMYRDNNIFGNEKKIFSLGNLSQKYKIIGNKVQFLNFWNF